MKLLTKLAMTISLLYYASIFSMLWLGQIFGWHNDIWEMFDFPEQTTSPPLIALLFGMFVNFGALAFLGMTYLAVWRILDGGLTQDFRDLAVRLKRIGIGLFGFWLGYNLLTGAVQHLIVIGLENTEDFDFGWDPLDIDIVFAILAVAIFTIAQTLERAWVAEEETKHFL